MSELAAPLSMSLAAVVQHIKVLELSGVVQSRKVGRVRTCELNPRGLTVAERWLASRRGVWERRLDRLGDFLDDEGTGASSAKAPPRRKAKKKDE